VTGDSPKQYLGKSAILILLVRPVIQVLLDVLHGIDCSTMLSSLSYFRRSALAPGTGVLGSDTGTNHQSLDQSGVVPGIRSQRARRKAGDGDGGPR
jgi:hypothetical protein